MEAYISGGCSYDEYYGDYCTDAPSGSVLTSDGDIVLAATIYDPDDVYQVGGWGLWLRT